MIFSVEQIPQSKVSAAFITQANSVFRESALLAPVRTPDGIDYMPWGNTDQLPYDIINLIEEDETLSTCQNFSAETCYGAGLSYDTSEASTDVALAAEEFVSRNNFPEYFLASCQDFKFYNFAVSLIILSTDRKSITNIVRLPACYCRFAPSDPVTGRIPYIVYGQFRAGFTSNHFDKIDLLDPINPLADLQARSKSQKRVFRYAVVSRFPTVDNTYYPIPNYASLFKGPWYKIKRLIGEAKLAKLRNSAPIKYVIEISQSYWDRKFRENNVSSPAERNKIIEEHKRQMLNFLTDIENSNSVLFVGQSFSVDGKTLSPDVKVNIIDSKLKQGGDWESDIAEAINIECFTMRIHSNLVGSVPGKSQSNNSGSDKRELYTIAQSLQKPYRDILFGVHRLIIAFNGYTGVKPVCPFIQLTTLDKHTDARLVDNNS